MKNTYAIINMRASRAKVHSKAVKSQLIKHGVKEERIYLVEKIEEIAKTYQKVNRQKPGLIIIGGGDGTIIQTIDWFNDKGYKGHYGIIPLGTANYLARNLEIPLKPKAAINKIFSGRPKKIQFATANGKIFSLMATIGLLTRISKHVKVKNKQRFGQIAYISEGIRQLRNHDSFSYDIKLNDSKKNISGRAIQLVAFNADLNMQLNVAPASDITKPWLKLSIYKEESNTFIVLLNILLYVVSLRKFRRGIKTYKVNSLELKTDPEMEVSIDGEVSAKTPLEIIGGEENAKIVL